MTRMMTMTRMTGSTVIATTEFCYLQNLRNLKTGGQNNRGLFFMEKAPIHIRRIFTVRCAWLFTATMKSGFLRRIVIPFYPPSAKHVHCKNNDSVTAKNSPSRFRGRDCL